MEVVGSLVELGISFAPVPGLLPAFNILKYIWENVQKASYNRDSLRNLAISTADILIAVNHVLSRTRVNENVREMLYKLEKVLEEIGDFAKKHVSRNLFKTLIKNVDVEGKIEFFQNRLQVLSMAFNIAAYGAIESQLETIMKQRSTIVAAPYSSAQDSKIIAPRQDATQTLNKPVLDYEPVWVEASFSEPCTIEVQKEIPCLSCNYFNTVKLSLYGIGTPHSKIENGTDTFDIVRLRDSQTYAWTLAGKVVSVSIRDPTHPEWRDMMDIVFPEIVSATTWFSWLEKYASSDPAASRSRPSSCKVNVRKKYDCWMQKTPTRIERRRPSSKNWLGFINGKGKSLRAYATYVTYISNDNLPYNTIYRSGDTLVIERSTHIQDDEPTVNRRYRFDNEEMALVWFGVWRNYIASAQPGGGPGIR